MTGTSADQTPPVGTTRAPEDTPSRESTPSGPTTDRGVREAVQDLQDRPDQDPRTGRFVPGNTAAGKALDRSEALWSELAPVKAALVDQVKDQLAVNGDTAPTLAALVDAFAEASLLRRSLFLRMAERGGPITAKGRVRSLFQAWLSTLDKERRLALDLGLERRQRNVADPHERIRQAVEDASK